MSGSPPLARGTPPHRKSPVQGVRLTPARAGNTVIVPPAVGGYSAHPRSRGEHWLVFAPVLFVGGSPPLARGTQGLKLAHGVRARLTPARAGNT